MLLSRKTQTHHGTHVKRTESTEIPRKSIIIGTEGRNVESPDRKLLKSFSLWTMCDGLCLYCVTERLVERFGDIVDNYCLLGDAKE
jgi:hypothetical protein